MQMKKKKVVAKCPYCQAELIPEDNYDAYPQETEDGSWEYVEVYMGSCIQCNKWFDWKEIRDVVRIEDLIEDKRERVK